MKHLSASMVLLFLISGFSLCVATEVKKASAEPFSGRVMESIVSIPAAEPCTLARSVTEQLGLLAPQIWPLPNNEAFGAANGKLKIVVACRLTEAEAYTYERLLSFSGVGLLVFKGNERHSQVIEKLTSQLGLTIQRLNPSTSDDLPLSYIFPAQMLRLSINADVDQGNTAPAAAADLVGKLRQPTLFHGAQAGAETPVLPPTETAKNIWELYLLVKAKDPDLGRAQARLAGSKADVDIVFAGLLPHVSASGGLSFINQTLFNYTPGEQESSVLGYSYELTVQAPLLHVPTLYNLSAATANQRGADAGVSVARQNLMVKFTDAYFGVLKAQGDRENAKEEIARLRQVLDQATAFLKAGTGDIIAVYEAKARLDSVFADLDRSESNLTIAEQRLSTIVGKQVTTVTNYLQKYPHGPEPNDLEWWLSTMEKQDPQVCQAREGLTQTQLMEKSAKAERLPVLDVLAGYNANKGSAFLPNVETNQWSLGATITLPLYSGGETSARIRRAAADEVERGFLLEQVLEQRRDNLRQIYFNLIYNVSLIKALEQKKSSAEIQLNAIKKGRSIGTRTAVDLLNAEEAYAVAQRDLNNALYDNIVGVIQLKSAAGILDEADISAITTFN
jgi:outer membrane protein